MLTQQTDQWSKLTVSAVPKHAHVYKGCWKNSIHLQIYQLHCFGNKQKILSNSLKKEKRIKSRQNEETARSEEEVLGAYLTLAFRSWILLQEAECVPPSSTWKYSSLKSEALLISWEKQEEGHSERTCTLILLLQAHKIVQPFIHPKHISFHISCKNCWPLSTIIQATRHTKLIEESAGKYYITAFYLVG